MPQTEKHLHPPLLPAPLPAPGSKLPCSFLSLVIEWFGKMESNYLHVQREKIKLDCSIFYGFYKMLMYVVGVDGKAPPVLEGRAPLWEPAAELMRAESVESRNMQ